VNNGPFLSKAPDPGRPFHAPWPVAGDGLPARLHQVPAHVVLVADNGGQFASSAAYVGIAEAESLDGVPWGKHRTKQKRGDNYGYSDGHVEFHLKQELDALAIELDPDFDGGGAGGPTDPWKWR
jgi:hypothetical protein